MQITDIDKFLIATVPYWAGEGREAEWHMGVQMCEGLIEKHNHPYPCQTALAFPCVIPQAYENSSKESNNLGAVQGVKIKLLEPAHVSEEVC